MNSAIYKTLNINNNINNISEDQNQNKCCPVICRHGGHYMDYCCLITVNINIIDQETTLLSQIKTNIRNISKRERGKYHR